MSLLSLLSLLSLVAVAVAAVAAVVVVVVVVPPPARERVSHRLPDGVGTNRVFTEGSHFLPFCHMLFQVRTCCHILPHVVHIFRESSSGGIAALLRRPRLSRPRLEAGECHSTTNGTIIISCIVIITHLVAVVVVVVVVEVVVVVVIIVIIISSSSSSNDNY